MRHSFRFCSLTLIIAALSIQVLAQAAKTTTLDPDEPVIHEFVLTMAKVQKFSDIAKR